MLKKLDSCSDTILLKISLFSSLSLVATIVLIEKERNASGTERVPSAESFLPVKGKTSGPLCDCVFTYTQETKFTKPSTILAISK